MCAESPTLLDCGHEIKRVIRRTGAPATFVAVRRIQAGHSAAEVSAFLGQGAALVEDEVRGQLVSMLRIDKENPNFTDTDYQRRR